MTSSKELRKWAVERALEVFSIGTVGAAAIVTVARVFEQYILEEVSE